MNASGEPTPLNAEELAWLSNSETFRDPDARWDTAWLRSALATIDAQATEIAALKEALEELREQLQHDFAIRCRCDFVTKLPAGIERCVGCRARDRIEAISRVLAGKEAQR